MKGKSVTRKTPGSRKAGKATSGKFSHTSLRHTEHLNNYAGPKLPFIIIEGLKILIDSGASSSIMNSSVANERFKNYFYPYNFKLTTVKQNHYGNIAFKYPLFTNYNINKPIKFLVLDWNNHYDALISTNDLKQLGAILNYQTNTLTIQGKSIPFYEELNNVNPMPSKKNL